MLLKLIINYTASDDHIWKGILYAFLLLITSSMQTIFLSRYFYDMYIIGIYIKSSVTSAIYRKSLKISSSGKKETTTGEVVNLMSVDTQRVVDMMVRDSSTRHMFTRVFRLFKKHYLLHLFQFLSVTFTVCFSLFSRTSTWFGGEFLNYSMI